MVPMWFQLGRGRGVAGATIVLVWPGVPTAPGGSLRRRDSGGRLSALWGPAACASRRRSGEALARSADGLTRVQASASCAADQTDVVIAGAPRRTWGRRARRTSSTSSSSWSASARRSPTTAATCAVIWCRSSASALDRIDAARSRRSSGEARRSGLSSKTVCNQLNFLHGVFAFAISAAGRRATRFASSTGRAHAAPRTPRACASCSARSSTRCCARCPRTTSGPSSGRCICARR